MNFYKDYSWQPNAFLERATIEDTTVTYALVNPKTKRFTSQTAKKTEYRKATHYDNDSYILGKKPTIALSIIFRLIRKMLERRIKNEIPNKTHIMQSCIHLHSNSRMRTMGI